MGFAVRGETGLSSQHGKDRALRVTARAEWGVSGWKMTKGSIKAK